MQMEAAALPYPYYICDRSENSGKSLTEILRPSPVTAFVGSGGKTASILALAKELAAQDARVIITTTTKILPVNGRLPHGIQIFGTPLSDGKLGPAENPEQLVKACDFLLIEADGSRGLPVKAPGEHEPPIPEFAEAVIAVQGLTAFGKPIFEACHRPERVCALLNKTSDAALSPEDGAKLLLSGQGQMKNVGSRRYAMILNQADGEQERCAARQIISLLPESLCCAVTAYKRNE